MNRTLQVWGVLNLTPDSFSDGGQFRDVADAVEAALIMKSQGADVVDIGGESTRPAGPSYGKGFDLVSAEEEIDRVVPVIEALKGKTTLSLDTRKGQVAEAGLNAGATIINDVSGGADETLLRVVAKAKAELVLMHNRSLGELDQTNLQYANLISEVKQELTQSAARAEGLGIDKGRLWLDPGVGFAKDASQSLQVCAAIDELSALGHPILIGVSRKSLIAKMAPRPDGTLPSPLERSAGTAALNALTLFFGASAIRVHDVAEGYQVARLVEALLKD